MRVIGRNSTSCKEIFSPTHAPSLKQPQHFYRDMAPQIRAVLARVREPLTAGELAIMFDGIEVYHHLTKMLKDDMIVCRKVPINGKDMNFWTANPENT